MVRPKSDLIKFARKMRSGATRAEQVLWSMFADGRRRRVLGHRVRRQHVVAGFIPDFYIPAARLAIEVDGSIHERQWKQDADGRRTEILKRHGVSVIRFTNNDVLSDPVRCLMVIVEAVRSK